MLNKGIHLISIIIPTKNEENNIASVLDSIKKQTYHNFEIVIVDNHSKDKTRQIASRYTKNIFIKGPERSVQRNFGSKQAKGDILLFLDADMELSKQVLSEINHELVSSDTIIIIPEMSQRSKNYWGKVVALDKLCAFNESSLHAARAFSREMFEEVGGYDAKMYAGEDWDLTIRCKQKGAIVKSMTHCIYHNEEINNFKSLLEKEKYYIYNIASFKKKHPHYFGKFSSPAYRGKIYLKNWKKIVSDPFVGTGLLFYKIFIYFISRQRI